MLHAHCMKTVMGGLSLVLILSACSSGAKSRKADTTQARSNVSTTHDPADRMTTQRDQMAATERPVPSDRLGSGDSRPEGQPSDRLTTGGMAGDRVVPCADAKGDMTASLDCDRMNRAGKGDRMALSDRSPEIAAACANRVDAQGNVVFDDPGCPDRYRHQVGNDYYDEGFATACASHLDDKGKVVYEDKDCPARYRRQMGSSYQNVRWTQESAFYDRYASKAVKHAREAEIAGNHGHIPEMLRHTELSLDQAKEAQRAGHHPDLDAGIAALRQTILLAQGNQAPGATSSVREARVRLSKAAGIKVKDTRPAGQFANPTGTGVGQRNTQTIRGELSRSGESPGIGGGEHYVVRDSQNKEMPISLSPEMSRQVQVGDVVEAQIDSSGQVTSITKTQ